MIQRKQSIFLLLSIMASVFALILPVGIFEPQGIIGVGTQMYCLCTIDAAGVAQYSTSVLFVLQVLAAAASLTTIFLYSRRYLQMRLCWVVMIIHILWYAVYVFAAIGWLGTAGGEGVTFRPELAAVAPMIALILTLMALLGVRHDERLIRSAERIR